jgi:hypothetical protein
VYCHFQVEEKRTVQNGPTSSRRWKTVIDDVQSIPWGVDDGTETAGLDLAGAELMLKPASQLHSGFWTDAPPKLESVLNDRYGRSGKGLLFNKAMRYTETLIEEGDDLLVLGQWEAALSGAWQFRKGSGPYIVSNKSHGALLSSYKGSALFWSALAVVILVVPCLPLGLRLFLR